MDQAQFSRARAELGKTQAQMAELLQTSLKAVQSYEQGWRTVPAHAEKQVLFLLALKAGDAKREECWTALRCPPERRRRCPAWELKAGRFCWFVNGTLCGGKPQATWRDKMKICGSCRVMESLAKFR